MGANTTAFAYPDARAFLDKVLEAERGLRATFPTHGKAIRFRQSCYSIRVKERKRTTQRVGVEEYSGVPWDRIALEVELNEDGTAVLVAYHDGDAALEKMQIEEI